ncbi:hypothetical protein PHLGIDRAFT_130883 [Phlebiopsis gigantea 11061_1 CR5-6]|uniref:G-protein coupled receptors family 1 profile domain-containing protein n=1 Tax=Phlebiopsis gigantea (strain 11061_1 CR5-6) TaxID=745531 RepID=A0A0C3NCC9_PHLG1|nr:hypothetical protein PHLGIDRAFT_130883 [Phlebiopsis gigantea 11061_1 CR5-6]
MSSLSDADAETLQSIGHDTIQNIVAICVEAVLWTIYLVLIVIAGNILTQKQRRTTISLVTFTVVLLMFLMDTSIFFIDVNNAVKEIMFTLTSSSDMSLQDRYSLTDNLPWPVESALYAFMSNLGDIIVIWRVYAFYHRGKDRWVVAIPCALLVGSFITSGLISFCVSKLSDNPGATGNFINPPFCKNVQLASYCTTLATTGVATMLISYKTWRYRRTIGRTLHKSSNKTRMERVMTILIESGILYFFFFLEAVVSDSGNVGELEESTPGLAFASTVWTFMTSHIMGIYPVIIVILVHLQRSYIEPAAIVGSGPLPSSQATSTSMNRSRAWSGSRAVASIQRPHAHAIEVNVHELHTIQGDADFRKSNVAFADDEFLDKPVHGDTKLIESA